MVVQPLTRLEINIVTIKEKSERLIKVETERDYYKLMSHTLRAMVDGYVSKNYLEVNKQSEKFTKMLLKAPDDYIFDYRESKKESLRIFHKTMEEVTMIVEELFEQQ